MYFRVALSSAPVLSNHSLPTKLLGKHFKRFHIFINSSSVHFIYYLHNQPRLISFNTTKNTYHKNCLTLAAHIRNSNQSIVYLQRYQLPDCTLAHKSMYVHLTKLFQYPVHQDNCLCTCVFRSQNCATAFSPSLLPDPSDGLCNKGLSVNVRAFDCVF